MSRDRVCIVCQAEFRSWRPADFCSDKCRKKKARGAVCVCGHYESRHTGTENDPCTALVGRGRSQCYCSSFRPRR